MKIIDFYNSLDKKKKIILWVAIALVFFSILRVFVWRAKNTNIPTEKKIFKQIYLPDKKKKIEGIYAIGQFKKEEYLPEVEKIFTSTGDVEIKRVAAWAIGKINIDKLKGYLDIQNKENKILVIDTLLKIDKNNIDFLIERFPKEDKETKLYIIDLINKEEYSNKLLEIAENKDEEKEIRQKALSMLEKVGNNEHIPKLWDLYYNDTDSEIQMASYKTIKEIEKRGKK